MSKSLFSSLALKEEVLKNLESLGYHEMTPIQAQALPHILANKDVLGQAKTGSGKTAAFGLGILSKIAAKNFNIQALILCPTRELALQVAQELRKLARQSQNIKIQTLCGGRSLVSELPAIEHGMHVVVATPGRLLDHLTRGNINLKFLKTLVLDEADRMLDMGFFEDIEQITQMTPERRQTLLFSATYSEQIKEISKNFQRDCVEIKVETAPEAKTQIEEQYFRARDNNDKFSLLLNLLAEHQPESTLIFCNTKIQCAELLQALQEHSCLAMQIHGDLEQRDREEALMLFANRSCPVLVATDVAARGIDIKDLSLVVNFELSAKPDTHMHRIGRTGRAGQSGLAVSFYLDRERRRLENIAQYQNNPVAKLAATRGTYASIKPTKGLQLPQPAMMTLSFAAGRKNKIRKGDLLGALTGQEVGLEGSQIGKIDIFDFHSCVAVKAEVAKEALAKLNSGKIKGRYLKVRLLSP